MLYPSAVPLSADAVDAVRDFLRLDGDGEANGDRAVLATLIVAAIAQCEGFIGSALIEREFVETLEGSGRWTRLGAWPVMSITGVATTEGVALPVGAFAIDIAADGIGRVRLTDGSARRIRATYRAGRGTGWSAIAEPVRQAIVELVAHRYEARLDTTRAGLPDGVVSAWRAARRLVLS